MIFAQREAGLVARLNVSNVETSAKWYESKLGLTQDHRFDAPGWRQLNLNGVTGAAIGVSEDAPSGTGGSTITFVVSDIEEARQELIAEGVSVGPIEPAGDGVLLAFFTDEDQNKLGLRQNGPSHPAPLAIGAA
jgi:catechol 2,3-dioxygenase-like lactoylglutathione lyase family enzyme